MERICRNCGENFIPHPSVPHQEYCGKPCCQKTRKREWQHEKIKHDQDYRENQAAAQKAWRIKNPRYWREYRKRSPVYAEQNRFRQRDRNRLRRKPPPVIAKMDELKASPIRLSGKYLMIPLRDGMIAKMDEQIVEINPIAGVST